jgi:hypothetical protein
MPRRKKPYIGADKTLVNGARYEPIKYTGGHITVADLPEVTGVALQEVKVDVDLIREKVAAYIQKFDELAQLADRDQFVSDLTDQCVWARTLQLDCLVKGARSKPDEWNAQIFARGLASIMCRHGLQPTISEYDDGNQVRQSLYLRLIPDLSKIAGCRVPTDLKGHALRARRINHQG